MLIVIMFFVQQSVAQRASYVKDRKQTTQKDIRIKLTEESSLTLFVKHLKLDENQKKQVGRLLSQHRLRPVKGEDEVTTSGMSFENRKRIFNKALQGILSDKQYARYLALQ